MVEGGAFEDNIKADVERGVLQISVNPQLYSIDAINEAAALFKDRALLAVSGDPVGFVFVEFRLKGRPGREEMVSLAYEFTTALVEAAVREIGARRQSYGRSI